MFFFFCQVLKENASGEIIEMDLKRNVGDVDISPRRCVMLSPHRLHSERETLTLFAPCRPASLGHPLYTLYLETHRKQHQQLRQTRNGNEKARKTSKSGWLVHSFIKLATSTKSERDNSSGIDLFDYLIIYICAFHYYQGLEQA